MQPAHAKQVQTRKRGYDMRCIRGQQSKERKEKHEDGDLRDMRRNPGYGKAKQ
jgi:hypothetical protein